MRILPPPPLPGVLMSDRKKDSIRVHGKFYMYLDIVPQPEVTIICASGLVTSTFSISVCIVPLFSAIIGFIGLLALEVCN